MSKIHVSSCKGVHRIISFKAGCLRLHLFSCRVSRDTFPFKHLNRVSTESLPSKQGVYTFRLIQGVPWYILISTGCPILQKGIHRYAFSFTGCLGIGCRPFYQTCNLKPGPLHFFLNQRLLSNNALIYYTFLGHLVALTIFYVFY